MNYVMRVFECACVRLKAKKKRTVIDQMTEIVQCHIRNSVHCLVLPCHATPCHIRFQSFFKLISFWFCSVPSGWFCQLSHCREQATELSSILYSWSEFTAFLHPFEIYMWNTLFWHVVLIANFVRLQIDISKEHRNEKSVAIKRIGCLFNGQQSRIPPYTCNNSNVLHMK